MNFRNDGRTYDSVRPIKLTYNSFGYSDSSVLFEQGNTKILVGVTLQDGVPQFLRRQNFKKGQRQGWLTAEYSMLPTATRGRTIRDSNQARPNARGVEISRLIGRSFRSVIDLSCIGERTVYIDCDVLQADGGTRCASICAANFALQAANANWLKNGVIEKSFIREEIAAISVGMLGECAYLDLSQFEDNRADVDFNFVLTKGGNIIELQGTSERTPMAWENFEQLKKLALKGCKDIFEACKNILVPEAGENVSFRGSSGGKPPVNGRLNLDEKKQQKKFSPRGKNPLFSLKNRMQNKEN